MSSNVISLPWANIFELHEIIRLSELIEVARGINIEDSEDYNSRGAIYVLSALIKRMVHQYELSREREMLFDSGEDFYLPNPEIEDSFAAAEDIMRRIVSRYDNEIYRDYPDARFKRSKLTDKRLRYLKRDFWLKEVLEEVPSGFLGNILYL